MKKKLISTLDQCATDAIKAFRQPERQSKRLAETRAEILDDVREFLELGHILEPVDRLLSHVTNYLDLCATIEKDYNDTGVESEAYLHLPTFSHLNDTTYYIAEIIKFITCIGEKQDVINDCEHALIMQGTGSADGSD